MPCWKCGKPDTPPPITPPTPHRKGIVQFCDVCDPCNPAASNVRLCAFVVPTLEDGRYFKNSFVFVQEDDSVYYISDDRSEIPFGSRPKFIDNFEPDKHTFKNTVVYDLVNKTAYVYGADGTRMSLVTADNLLAGTGILIASEEGKQTVSIDETVVVTKTELNSLLDEIESLKERVAALEGN